MQVYEHTGFVCCVMVPFYLLLGLKSSVPYESRYGDYFPLHFAMIRVLFVMTGQRISIMFNVNAAASTQYLEMEFGSSRLYIEWRTTRFYSRSSKESIKKFTTKENFLMNIQLFQQLVYLGGDL